MESDMTNPYKAPESSVEKLSSGELAGVLPRFSAWGVFGLSIITLGIYGIYWLYTRTQKLNAVLDKPINSVFTTITLVLYSLSLITNFVPKDDPVVAGVLSLLGLAGGIMMIVWVFMIRRRIHEYVGIPSGHPQQLGPILTFFFSTIYLQYKINQIIDIEKGSASTEGAG